ncbi:MAG: type II toxin-antitoxin system RelE/ParE family toxin [Proteobacteria bacterium]|nr:type II toxin-antitoxin system RelE/ParE family toxin [Pseudomonadota bacterium]MBU2260692.1 type II toxin-antitoxin system RelE/ParE family toxin [Pseudomonadota bacterium]
MIKSFRHKGLSLLFLDDISSRVAPDMIKRCRIRLAALDEAERLEDLNIPGFDFHSLRGKPKRYSIHVNGPWCITFEWLNGDVWRVDLVQYH